MFANLLNADSICRKHGEGDILPANNKHSSRAETADRRTAKRTEILPSVCLDFYGREEVGQMEMRATSRDVTEDSKQ